MAPFSLTACILTCALAMACTEGTMARPRPSQTDNASDDMATTTLDTSDTDNQDTAGSDTPTESQTGDTTGNCTLNSEQTFVSSTLPKGWSITDGDEDGYTWQWSGTGNNIGTGSGAGHYWIDAAKAGTKSLDEDMTTQELERGGCAKVRLYFTHRFDRSSDQGRVSIQVDGGSWKTLQNYVVDDSGSESIDLTSALGSGKKFRIQFNYEGVGTQYWRVDDVLVVGTGSQ